MTCWLKTSTPQLKQGRNAQVSNPAGQNGRASMPCNYLNLAEKYADADEKKYLWLIGKRLENGSLSELIRDRVQRRAQKTDFP